MPPIAERRNTMEQKNGDNTYRNFINGKWSEPDAGEYYQVFSPGNTEESAGFFPLSNETDVHNSVAAAAQQFHKWRLKSPSERTEYLYRFNELLAQNKQRLAEAATLEQGKLLNESLGEVSRGVKEILITAGEALRLEGIARPSDSARTINTAERVPIGVVATITPWNFPIITPLRKIIPALASGCTVILKPATATPHTSVIITELFEQAGLPAGALNLIMGSGSKIGNAISGHPQVNGISFTGSSSVGRQIYKTAAENFTKVQLEMGGKNAAVVVNYSDLKKIAPQIVKAALVNAGQRCTSISRVIVLENQAEELERLIIQESKSLKPGHGLSSKSDIGPLINKAAEKKMTEYVQSALEEGASLACGGKKPEGRDYEKGFYFNPTILTNVNKDMRVAKEEIFGPILSIIRVKSYNEAIEVCNATEYGLTASVFTDDMAFSYDFKTEADVGMIRINNLGVSGGNMPFGGSKHSGVGAFSIGSTTMDFYTKPKVTYTEY